MNHRGYRPRIMDNTIEKYLKTFDAVCIEGPKWCGKTWTASYHSQSEIYVGDPTGEISLENLCNDKIEPVMTGEVDLRKIIECIVKGGWPGNLGTPVEQAALLPLQYIEAIVEDDVYRIDGVKRNGESD